MTEQEWMECGDPQKMLSWLAQQGPSDRKLRLFATACCRRIWHLLTHEDLQRAVEVAERFADGQADTHELSGAEAMAGVSHHERWGAAWGAASEDALEAAWESLREAAGWNEKELSEEALYLRHIFGNPFRPYPAPGHWPSTVIQLAESLYNGQDCSFALHDALLEAGHAELAEHFNENNHPKGCWVMDMILGKA
jgi:hypothetical protein